MVINIDRMLKWSGMEFRTESGWQVQCAYCTL